MFDNHYMKYFFLKNRSLAYVTLIKKMALLLACWNQNLIRQMARNLAAWIWDMSLGNQSITLHSSSIDHSHKAQQKPGFRIRYSSLPSSIGLVNCTFFMLSINHSSLELSHFQIKKYLSFFLRLSSIQKGNQLAYCKNRSP